MNYTESGEIFEKIKSANKILINCHHLPDADSVGSATATKRVIEHFLKKQVKIICPSPLPPNLDFMDEKIETVDFSDFNFSDYDLFILLDTSSWNRASGSHDVDKPDILMINIDHHKTNQKFGDINLVVADAAANAEIMYWMFQDWNVDFVDIEPGLPDIVTPLLTGIIGDTGAFRFPEADMGVFKVATDLMRIADKNKIIFNLYQSYQQDHVKVWRAILNNLKIDQEGHFVYSFIDKKTFFDSGKPFNAKSEMADMLFQSIDGTDFGFVGIEDEGYLSVSFRSRTGFDVSEIATKLGGGGHKWAAACRVNDMSFDEAREKVLSVVREIINEKK